MISCSYIGIDVSKAQLDLADASSSRRLPNTKPGVAALLKSLPPRAHLVLEATGGYERALVTAAHSAGVALSVLNPARVRHFARASGRLAKTDPIDAALLRDFGVALQPPADPVPHPARAQLAELVQARQQLVDLRTQLSNGLEHLSLPLLRQSFTSQIRLLNLRIAKIETAIEQAIAATDELASRAAVLASHRGVGPQTTAVLLAYLPELGQANRAQIAALAGLAPFNRDSGKFQGPRFTNGGRPQVRRALYLAALTTIRAKNSKIGTFYHHLRSNGKPAKVALIAAARKLLCHLNSSLKSLH
jgi:transposase